MHSSVLQGQQNALVWPDLRVYSSLVRPESARDRSGLGTIALHCNSLCNACGGSRLCNASTPKAFVLRFRLHIHIAPVVLTKLSAQHLEVSLRVGPSTSAQAMLANPTHHVASPYDEHGCGRLVVKNTFLSFVDADFEPPALARALTDSALCKLGGSAACAPYLRASPSRTTATPETSDSESARTAAPSDTDLHKAARGRSRCGAVGAHEHGHDGVDKRTTLMLRNLPNSYTRDMLLEMLNED